MAPASTTVCKCKKISHNCKIDTPIGVLTLSACENGLHSLLLPERIFVGDGKGNDSKENVVNAQDFTPNLNATLTVTFEHQVSDEQASKHLANGTQWIQAYFTHPENFLTEKPELPKFCDLNGTDFEINVWTTLKDTVYMGHHVSYGELAASMNNPKASRAVGTALKKNPLPLFIPCHRVIRSDGNFGKFSGGKWDGIKKFLIVHEAKP